MTTNNSTDDIRTLTRDVLTDIKEKMTDVVFLVIQNDHELMHRYLGLIKAHNVDTVNQEIGKAVKAELKHLDDKGRCNVPRSTLIQSFEMHM